MHLKNYLEKRYTLRTRPASPKKVYTSKLPRIRTENSDRPGQTPETKRSTSAGRIKVDRENSSLCP